MNKAKTNKIKTKKIFLIIGLVIGIVLIIGAIVVLSNTSNYAGTYNLDNRYSIVLKQDMTCDFTELGESGYSNNKLKCNYEVKDGTVYFTRDVISWRLEKDNWSVWGEGVGSKNTCEQFRNKGLFDYCKEEITSIQETAAVGETGIIYKDKTYIKLR